jgi:hypothetical protein
MLLLFFTISNKITYKIKNVYIKLVIKSEIFNFFNNNKVIKKYFLTKKKGH